MLRIRNIVCGTDFSPAARRAVEVAVDLAENFGAAVLLVHVIEPLPKLQPMPDEDGWAVDPDAFGQALKRQARLRLDELVDQFADREPALRPVATSGSIADRLMEAADAERADMIVVASVSDSARRGQGLGTVAAKVVAGASVPVMTVPAPAVKDA